MEIPKFTDDLAKNGGTYFAAQANDELHAIDIEAIVYGWIRDTNATTVTELKVTRKNVRQQDRDPITTTYGPAYFSAGYWYGVSLVIQSDAEAIQFKMKFG